MSYISHICLIYCQILVLQPAVVIEKPEIEESFGEDEQKERALVYKTDASTSPIPFLEEKNDKTKQPATTMTQTSLIDCKSTQTVIKSMADSGCMSESNSATGSYSLVCKTCGNTKKYSSIKFYTSLALAGLFAILFAVTQFSPEIHKSYSRPPPI